MEEMKTPRASTRHRMCLCRTCLLLLLSGLSVGLASCRDSRSDPNGPAQQASARIAEINLRANLTILTSCLTIYQTAEGLFPPSLEALKSDLRSRGFWDNNAESSLWSPFTGEKIRYLIGELRESDPETNLSLLNGEDWHGLLVFYSRTSSSRVVGIYQSNSIVTMSPTEFEEAKQRTIAILAKPRNAETPGVSWVVPEPLE